MVSCLPARQLVSALVLALAARSVLRLATFDCAKPPSAMVSCLLASALLLNRTKRKMAPAWSVPTEVLIMVIDPAYSSVVKVEPQPMDTSTPELPAIPETK